MDHHFPPANPADQYYNYPSTPSLDENGDLTGVNWPTKPE